ncbi:amino acid adenylation domain-containing protein [Streptomyces sp. JJ66]|uniref:non-ribosomal peptide synthetase n=1 Tax=Streptomyces sp. JJ66 TaxID=2803843 RepID=UPI001C55D110|nr:non-ribosomal peptide synthetase [Streptomyces sp. JJ66]MBW1600719.1 amino acid adenylation domain-containing protein [Streptomyces sp. JJ66]
MSSPRLPEGVPDTLPTLLAERVRATPDADALRCGATRLSYRELDRRASLLADRLRQAGVSPDVPVGIHLHRSVELAVAVFGVLKAAGACVPLDPAYPAERLAFVLGDVGASVLLTSADLAGRLPGHTARVLLVEDTARAAPSGARPTTGGADAGARLSSGHLGWIAYTSGSTGLPKGVPLAQGALAALARGIADRLDLTPADRVLQFASVGFSVAAEEILSTWAAGSCLVMDPDGELADSARLLDLVERERVSVLQLTPSYWYEWLRELDGGQGPVAPPSLRLLVVGSEPVAVDRVADWCATGVRLVQEYGATEATVSQVLYEAPAAPEEIRGWNRLPIGTPLPGVRAYILDDRLEPVPDGEAGELYLGGPGVSRGYVGLPALTADRFPPDPFTDRPGGRMYRTRDLARRRLPGGTLEFLGRIDYQLNIRGIRIEPGEVENAIVQFPGVLESAVLARPDHSGADQLVACVVWAGEPQVRALRARLREVLPPAQVPARFTALPSLPLNANGKVDRKALHALPLDLAPGRTGSGPREPLPPLQAALAEVWEEVLGTAPIGPDDDFFELGGDSLSAVRLAAACRARLGGDIHQSALFRTPTVAGLAAQLDGTAGAAARPQTHPDPVPADGDVSAGTVPAAFAQQRMWLLHKLAPGSPRFNEPVVLRLSGPLDRAAVQAALGALVTRHAALRTVFTTEDGLPVQVPQEPYEVELPLLDMTGQDEEGAAETVARLVREPFDLTRGPLLRTSLIRRGPEDHLLVMVLHHIVFDGGSTRVLFDEFGPLYSAAAAGTEAALPAPALKFSDWAREQHQQATEQGYDEQLAYWRKQLAGAPETTRLPALADGPAPARGSRGRSSGRGAVHTFCVPAPLTARLREVAGAERATLFMVLLSAFYEQVHRATGVRDLVVGTLTSGRDRPELDGVMGMFVNTLCLRTELEPRQPFRELLSSARRTVREALACQDVPFERVVEELRPARGRGHSVFFQLMLSYGSTPHRGPQLMGLECELVPCDTGTAKFDLTLALDEDGAGGLTGRLEHDFLRVGTAAARELAEGYLAVLERIAADPDHQVGVG